MKLIGSDYDGTLNHGGIDEEKLAAIRRWREAGHVFGVVSGRGPDFLAELQEKLGEDFDFYASCNGGVAVDAKGDSLFNYRCEGMDARAFVADLLDWGAPFAYVNVDDACWRVGDKNTTDEIEYLVEEMPNIPYFQKMAVFLPGPDEAGALAAKVREKYGDKVNPLQNWWCVDIAPYGVDKAAGLRRLAAHFGVAEEDIVAVGDNLNDAAMVSAFRGYAMAGGSEELKAVADFVTDSVTDLIVKELEESTMSEWTYPLWNDGQTDYVYKVTPQRDLQLTFVPPNKPKYDKAPLYFVLPGGGWYVEERLGMLNYAGVSVKALLDEGFACVAADYRVTPEGVFVADIIEDCLDALRYCAHHAEEWGVDANKFFISGHSAGAHLALMTGMVKDGFKSENSYDDPYTVCGIAPMSPITDLSDDEAMRFNHGYLFADPEDEAEKTRVSPITYAAVDTPDTLLIAGTSDYHVLPRHSEKLFDKLTECGANTRLMYSIAGGHGFEAMHYGVEPQPGMDGVQKEIVKFILERV